MQSLHPAQQLVIGLLPMVFAITIHEVAHGWMADRLGDPTARMLGRITLNPIKHVDPIGTLLVPMVTWLVAGLPFGWAKPVPVTPANLRRHRYGMALVAAAGPVSNLVQAFAWAFLTRLVLEQREALGWVTDPLLLMGLAGISFNISLAVLNLLPVLPLDGGRILDSLLPPRWSARYSQLEPYGLLIVAGLIVTKLLLVLMAPPYHAVKGLVASAAGLEGL